MTKRAHGSKRVWVIIFGHAYEDALRAEKSGRTKGDWIAVAVMIVLAGVGGMFAGFQIDTNLIHPPLQEVGVCPVSQGAQIDSQGCFTMQQITVTVNGQQQEKSVRVPAGHVLVPTVNATK